MTGCHSYLFNKHYYFFLGHVGEKSDLFPRMGSASIRSPGLSSIPNLVRLMLMSPSMLVSCRWSSKNQVGPMASPVSILCILFWPGETATSTNLHSSNLFPPPTWSTFWRGLPEISRLALLFLCKSQHKPAWRHHALALQALASTASVVVPHGGGNILKVTGTVMSLFVLAEGSDFFEKAALLPCVL